MHDMIFNIVVSLALLANKSSSNVTSNHVNLVQKYLPPDFCSGQVIFVDSDSIIFPSISSEFCKQDLANFQDPYNATDSKVLVLCPEQHRVACAAYSQSGEISLYLGETKHIEFDKLLMSDPSPAEISAFPFVILATMTVIYASISMYCSKLAIRYNRDYKEEITVSATKSTEVI
ncbi:MAG: hypothetical protein MHPSP_001890 [Paramarteilia canceri]